jgi:hypothetical protein
MHGGHNSYCTCRQQPAMFALHFSLNACSCMDRTFCACDGRSAAMRASTMRASTMRASTMRASTARSAVVEDNAGRAEKLLLS